MGSSLGRFSGTTQQHNMYKLVIVSLLAAATSLPIEDTADVAAAKAEFNAAFAAAEAGDHAALAPVNSDTQAAQIAAEYLADAEEVAAAKAAFQAAFVVAAGIPYGVSALTAVGGYPYAALPAALPYHGLPYAGLPYAGLPYAGLPLVPAPAKEE